METTFISIHDLSLDARLLYVSNSIIDILGYSPEEVVGKSCWEYFHPDEMPFARAIHGRGVQLDKAAVLSYCQIKNRYGRWIGCECVFTIVHDVLVASTSIYRRGMKSEKRAAEAPIIRQLFSSSPRDPRYHMLTYISSKFSQVPKPHSHEPRAALFLNRFTRTLTIMYATDGLAKVLGISAQQLIGKSFYYCIQENCLQEAVKCLESAKANDSIAYLRFWFRDPREDDSAEHDETMSDAPSSDLDEDEGGVHLDGHMATEGSEHATDIEGSDHAMISSSESGYSGSRGSVDNGSDQHGQSSSLDPNSRSSSGNSTDMGADAPDAIWDEPPNTPSSASSVPASAEAETRRNSRLPGTTQSRPHIELEAVVSCTSDGLVVVLRSARPVLLPPRLHPSARAPQPAYANGLFASPWGATPIMPHGQGRSHGTPSMHSPPNLTPWHPTAAQAQNAATHGPPTEDFMKSIREVAVFAWSLTGINGSLVQYGRGKPTGESQPPGGFPVWSPEGEASPKSDQHNGYGHSSHRPNGNDYSPSDLGQDGEAWRRSQQQREWGGSQTLLTVGADQHGTVRNGGYQDFTHQRGWS